MWDAERTKDIKWEGNWKKSDQWSDAAKGHYHVIATKYTNGETDRRMSNAIEALIEDLYAYNDHPAIVKLTEREAELIKLVRTSEVKDLLRQYGNYDIMYVPTEQGWPEAIRISPEIGLRLQSNGMPLSEFLRWYKGGDKLPRAVLEEWAGIPRFGFGGAYGAVVDFFRANIIQLHRSLNRTN